MRRPLVGIIALLLLIAGGWLTFWPPEEGSYQQLASPLLRVGAILAVLWLALPEVQKPGNLWLTVTLIGSVLFIAWKPKLAPLVLVVVAAIAILRPRKPKQPSKRT